MRYGPFWMTPLWIHQQRQGALGGYSLCYHRAIFVHYGSAHARREGPCIWSKPTSQITPRSHLYPCKATTLNQGQGNDKRTENGRLYITSTKGRRPSRTRSQKKRKKGNKYILSPIHSLIGSALPHTTTTTSWRTTPRSPSTIVLVILPSPTQVPKKENVG